MSDDVTKTSMIRKRKNRCPVARGAGAGVGGALNDNCVCVAARFINSPQCHPLKKNFALLTTVFSSQDCLVCPHGSWAFWGVDVGKTD